MTKMKSNLKVFAWTCLIIAVVLFALNYFFFHFVTDDGIVLEKQEEAGKPFVSNLIGMFATLFLFMSCAAFLFNGIVLKN